MRVLNKVSRAARLLGLRIFDNRKSQQKGRAHLTFTAGSGRLAYAYIRKNGSTAFKRLLAGDPDAPIHDLLKRHPYGRHDYAFFVYRDPVERMVSLYRNKVLDRHRAEDLLERYERTMGESPSGFDRFIEFARTEADPHCWTQRSHLRPLRYVAIALPNLNRSMRRLGVDIGEAANRSEPSPFEISDSARAQIRAHYAEDYEMIRSIRPWPFA